MTEKDTTLEALKKRFGAGARYVIRWPGRSKKTLRKQAAERRRKESRGSKRFRKKRRARWHGPRRQWVGKR